MDQNLIKRQYAHQGDVQFFELNSIPSNAKKIKKEFFARSERSGHCHALCGDYDMYEVDNGHIIVVGTDGATLNHTKENTLTPEYWDKNQVMQVADHNPTTFQQGIYFAGIQRKADPYKGVFERVID